MIFNTGVMCPKGIKYNFVLDDEIHYLLACSFPSKLEGNDHTNK